MAYTLRDDQFWPTGGVVAGHSSWRSDRAEAGGGALLEHSIHSCDILGWLFGPVERVYATTRSVFGYSGRGRRRAHDRARQRRGRQPRDACSTACSTARSAGSRCSSSGRRWSSRPTSSSARPKTRSSCTAPTSSTRSATTSNELRRETFAADGFDPDRQVFVYQYFAHHAFATALRDGRPPSPDVDDALRAHALVEAAYRSAAERRGRRPRGAPGAAHVTDGATRADTEETSMAPRIVIIGGGSNQWVPSLLTDIANTRSLREAEIVLEDINPEPLPRMAELAEHTSRLRNLAWKVSHTTNQRASLEGADFVVVAISTGGFDSMRHDVEIPIRYGIRMSVGDSGPRGRVPHVAQRAGDGRHRA